MQPIAIIASGMVTAVGLNAAAACAAIRCGIDNFVETRFRDAGGEWIIGSQVPLVRPWRGIAKLREMVVPAIRECLAHLGSVRPDKVPLVLCVAEQERPSRVQGLDDEFLHATQIELGVRFHPRSTIIAGGRVGGALALAQARRLVHEERQPFCLIAGVDSLLVASTSSAYEERNRLLTSQNSDGLIPGEAAGAVLVDLPSTQTSEPSLLCRGVGLGRAHATMDSEQPLRADGLVQAINAAMAEAQCGFEQLDYRMTDSNGEQYWSKEAALAMTRAMRVRKEEFDIWHPADCIGENRGCVRSLCARGRIRCGPAPLRTRAGSPVPLQR